MGLIELLLFYHILGPLGLKPDVRDNGDGTYDVSYVPQGEGTMQTTQVTWGGKNIPGRYDYIFSFWFRILSILF